MLGVSWEKLARRLGFHEGEITGFHKNNEEYSKKALKMLFGGNKKEELVRRTVSYTKLCVIDLLSEET